MPYMFVPLLRSVKTVVKGDIGISCIAYHVSSSSSAIAAVYMKYSDNNNAAVIFWDYSV